MKRFFEILLTVVMMLSTFVMVVPPIEAEAATEYNFLFPVNNGGVNIAFYYGSTPEYAGGAFHYGIDIYSNTDQVIYAAFSGTVTVVSNSCSHVHYPAEHSGAKCDHYSSWGNAVQIKSEDGKIVGIYGHLKQDSILVKNGDKIEKGQPLASMGSSGGSYNKHLHFEVRKSGTSTTINVNPTNSSKNPGVVNYSTDGYKQISSDVISEGTYIFNNGGYKMYMKKDASNFGTLGASNDTTTSKFEFNVIKDGNFYRVVPKDGGANYLNSVWTDTQDTHSLSGAEVTLCKNDKNDYSQKWIFEKYGDGYIIHPACTPAFAITRDGSKLIVEKTVYSDAQIWKLEGEECDHNYISFEWDDAYHWQECTKCGDKKNYEAHKWTVVTAAIGIDFHTLICEVCNDVKTPKHEYDNNCDASCNVCGAKRSVAHTYDNDCDSNCNDCGYMRQVEHYYSNACDASCDLCGAIRPIMHTYSDEFDATCNVCGATRDVAHIHSYGDYEYDFYGHWRVCLTCGEADGAAKSHTISGMFEVNDTYHGGECSVCDGIFTYKHTYTDNCDTSCDECENIREVTHLYTDNNDTICNSCGYERNKECQAHTLGVWTVTVEPTCISNGVMTRYCDNCEYFETKEISREAHNDTDGNGACDSCNRAIDEDNNDAKDKLDVQVSGCGSVIGGSLWFVVVILVGTVAVATDKKRKY